MDTANAVDNAPMIAVNEAIGYRPTCFELLMQRKL